MQPLTHGCRHTLADCYIPAHTALNYAEPQSPPSCRFTVAICYTPKCNDRFSLRNVPAPTWSDRKALKKMTL